MFLYRILIKYGLKFWVNKVLKSLKFHNPEPVEILLLKPPPIPIECGPTKTKLFFTYRHFKHISRTMPPAKMANHSLQRAENIPKRIWMFSISDAKIEKWKLLHMIGPLTRVNRHVLHHFNDWLTAFWCLHRGKKCGFQGFFYLPNRLSARKCL